MTELCLLIVRLSKFCLPIGSTLALPMTSAASYLIVSATQSSGALGFNDVRPIKPPTIFSLNKKLAQTLIRAFYYRCQDHSEGRQWTPPVGRAHSHNGTIGRWQEYAAQHFVRLQVSLAGPDNLHSQQVAAKIRITDESDLALAHENTTNRVRVCL